MRRTELDKQTLDEMVGLLGDMTALNKATSVDLVAIRSLLVAVVSVQQNKPKIAERYQELMEAWNQEDPSLRPSSSDTLFRALLGLRDIPGESQ